MNTMDALGVDYFSEIRESAKVRNPKKSKKPLITWRSEIHGEEMFA